MKIQNQTQTKIELHFKELSNSDYKLLLKWISEGRDDGYFKKGDPLSMNSIKRYHQSILMQGWSYYCYIIYYDSKIIGYFDYKVKLTTACIEGIFIESKYRNSGIGSYCLRWIIADLRLRKCKIASIDVYKNNIPSIQTVKSIGFHRNHGGDRIENKKKSLNFIYRIKPFRRLKPKYEAYTNLKGANFYQHQLAIVEQLISDVKFDKNIYAVLGLGSVSREFGDIWSDIDLMIIGNKNIFNKYWIGEKWIKGFSVDLFLIDIESSPISSWDDSRKQAVGEGVILYSHNTKLIKDLSRTIRISEKEKQFKVAERILGIGWQGFHPKSWFNKEVYGYYWSLPSDLWITRGSMIAAHSSLNFSFQMLVELIFFINDELPPDKKWLYFVVNDLNWLPVNFGKQFFHFLSLPANDSSFNIKSKIFYSLFNSVFLKLKRSNLIHKNLYKIYLNNIKEY